MDNNYQIKYEIDIKDLISHLWKDKLKITIYTLISAILSVFISLSINNKYVSFAVLAPVYPEETLSSQLSSLSPLSSLGGIRFPDSNSPQTNEAIERISSFNFFTNHFVPEIKLQDLMAAKEWDRSNNRIIYDSSIYDEINSSWVVKESEQNNETPSLQKAYREYDELLNLTQDPDTQFITISIIHISPHVAKNWVDIIVKNINESMRQQDKEKAEVAIAYLKEAAESTNIQSLKDAISNLLENQMQTLMLAASNRSYVLKLLEPPIVPDTKSGPNRALICIVITFLGAFLAVLFSLSKYYVNLNRQS